MWLCGSVEASLFAFLAYYSSFISVNTLPVGKNITLTKLYSVRFEDIADLSEGVTGDFGNLGINAQLDQASLAEKVTEFRLHRPGFQHVPHSISLESNAEPGLFLRYKNYKFHLEKAKPTGLFEKDATFVERQPVGPHSISLELFTHPGWFLCHETDAPFVLKATSKVVGSKEFDQKCVFRPVVRTPGTRLTTKTIITPKPLTDERQKELKAAEAAKLLDSLVAKESAGEIMAAKPTASTPAATKANDKTNGITSTASTPAATKANDKTNDITLKPAVKKISGQIISYRGSGAVNPRLLQYHTGNQAVPRGGARLLSPQRYQRPYGYGLAGAKGPVIKPYGPAYGPRTTSTGRLYLGQQQYKQNMRGANAKYVQAYNQKPANQYNVRGGGWGRMSATNYARKGNYRQAIYPQGFLAQTLNQLSSASTMRTAKPYVQRPKPVPYRPPINRAYSAPARTTLAAKQQTPPSQQVKGSSSVAITSGLGSGVALSYHHPKEPKPVDPKLATVDKGDKCIGLKFFNKLRRPVKIISSMKMAGYLVTAETFKLKTIFKHSRRNRKVIFYAQDLDDKEEVLLNNNNVVTVIPGPCDMPYRQLYITRPGQFTNQAIEDLLKQGPASTRSVVQSSPTGGFGQWSAFGPCSTSCGSGFQTRSRSCLPSRACLGPTVETRACIQPPCTKPQCVQTYGGNSNVGKCCSLPFIFRDTVYDKCIKHTHTGNMWCATTPNYDQDRTWGFCKQTERRSNTMYRPPGYLPAPVPHVDLPSLPSGCDPSCYNMCIPGCHVTCCSAHALAFPSI
ncbi:uncharacterized protein LOC5506570 isoform X2 [Nematostella vectensis]|uniref:uncharacterized protein LOC5506570 isoform X2 n=1 Tax=Nematostella vectensis TaxID=45351 RepID=UPI0020776BEB|nr:uncharacterized protein LOC5506570 isoform X2 [Nematostella vectensis]